MVFAGFLLGLVTPIIQSIILYVVSDPIQNRVRAFKIDFSIFAIIGAFSTAIAFESFLENRMSLIGAFLFGAAAHFWIFLIFLLSRLEERKTIQQERDAIKSKIASEDRHRQIKQEMRDKTNQKRIQIYQTLLNDPEQSRASINEKYGPVDREILDKVIEQVFKQFLDEKEFTKAESLLNYFPVDETDLLNISKKLDKNETNENVELNPTIFKVSLFDNETAYEKLPCNWQKIHTYLAPLADEIEQADILDSGNIYITDQRVFFVGKKGSETVYLNDIAYMDHKEDALQFFRDEGLSEIFAFPTPHHATYARLVIEELMGRQG